MQPGSGIGALFHLSKIGAIFLGYGSKGLAWGDAEKRDAQLRTRYLAEAKRDINARLAASMHNARFVDLGVEGDSDAVRPLWGYYDPERKTEYSSVLVAFEQCDQRLLLLGNPGGGKTTALLHIAQAIAEAANADDLAPVPLVVNLSKFRFDREKKRSGPISGLSREGANEKPHQGDEILEWLASEVSEFPGFRRESARKWLAEGRFAVLFDGFDEFDDEKRAELAIAFNEGFLLDYPEVPVVVCSRINEYATIRGDQRLQLKLKGAAVLQPLTTSQIDQYLIDAKAEELLKTIKLDNTLAQLAKTPLTLAMLVLAYADTAPTVSSSTLSFSETRFQLFETYVSRMLQRYARRQMGVPFDSIKANDVPVDSYRYTPSDLDRWLGWLALTLSVRMRTTFDPNKLVGLLSVGNFSQRDFLNFWVSYASIGFGAFLSLLLIALFLVPPSAPNVLIAGGIIAVAWFALPISAAVKRGWAVGEVAQLTLLVASFALLTGLTSQIISEMIPGKPSPLLFVPIAVALALVPLFAFSDDIDVRERGWLHIAAVLAGLIAAGFYWFSSTLPAIESALPQFLVAMLMWVVVHLCIVQMFDEDGFIQYIVIFVLNVFMMASISYLSIYVFDYSNWKWLLLSFSTALCFFCLVDDLDIRLRFSLVLMWSVIVAFGTALGGLYVGAVSSVAGALFVFIVYDTIIDTYDLGPIVEDAADRFFLSPVTWVLLCLTRQFPVNQRMFLEFTEDTFLLKRSGNEFEFVHRLIRDHFALKSLRPGLDMSSTNRLETIRSLGFQGEASLDLLVEYTEDQNSSVRAAALTALRHVASPQATICFEKSINDRDAEVRKALLEGIFALPASIGAPLLRQVKPIDPQIEVPIHLRHCSWYYEHEIVDFMEKMGDPAIDVLINEFLFGEEYKVRENAKFLLRRISNPYILNSLFHHLDKPEKIVISIIEFIIDQGNLDSLVKLNKMVRNHSSNIRKKVEIAIKSTEANSLPFYK